MISAMMSVARRRLKKKGTLMAICLHVLKRGRPKGKRSKEASEGGGKRKRSSANA